jgi:hypothetical protein
MSGENDHELINFIAVTVETMRGQMSDMREQMATKDDIVRLESRMEIMREQMDTMGEQMATKDELARVEASLREDMATKNDLSRLETTMRGEFEQVHIRLDSIDRRVETRVGQIETDVSRLRSVVYLLVKDKPDMLRLLGQTTPRERPPQG